MPFKNKKILFNEENKKFGFFIRMHRKKQQTSLNILAELVGITPSFLSDIEHGKKCAAPYTIKKLLKILSIDENLYFHDKNDIDEGELINDILNFDIDSLDKAYTTILSRLDGYLKTSNYDKYILYYVITISFTKDKSIFDEEFLKEYYEILMEEEKFTFDIFHAYSLEKNDKIEDAILKYKYLIDHFILDSYKNLKGWLFFRLSECNLIIGDLYESLQFYNMADDFFKNSYHLKRMMYGSIIKSNILAAFEKYNESEILLWNLYKTANELNDTKLIILILHNICSIHLQNNNFVELIRCTNIVYKYETSIYIHFYRIYAYIKLNMQEETSSYFDSLDIDSYDDNLIKCVLYYLKDYFYKNEGIKENINLLFTYFKNEINYFNKKFIKSVLIDYYIKEENYEFLCKYKILY